MGKNLNFLAGLAITGAIFWGGFKIVNLIVNDEQRREDNKPKLEQTAYTTNELMALRLGISSYTAIIRDSRGRIVTSYANTTMPQIKQDLPNNSNPNFIIGKDGSEYVHIPSNATFRAVGGNSRDFELILGEKR